jgi:hypothetical protein
MSAGRSSQFGADPIVVAYGAGVDSTALLIGLRDRGVKLASSCSPTRARKSRKP